MKNKKGISLIVLIVTIIVMIIIAGAIIISLNSTNVIDMASKAIKEYGDAEFEEGLTLIYSDNLIGNYTGKSFNNKKVANDILNMFGYPNINESTGLVEGGENGKFTTEKYIIESQDGQVKITNPNSKEILLQVLYDKTNKPDFKVVYNNVIYTYDNLNLLSKCEYYKEGVAEDWTYTENTTTGTLTLTKFNGEVQADENGLKHLTVPNKLNGKVVSTANIQETTALNAINGTLTVSPGITVNSIKTKNITKLILMENVKTINPNGNQGNITIRGPIKDMVIKSGCNIAQRTMDAGQLENIELDTNVTINNRFTYYASKLTSKSVNEVIAKANFVGHEMFFNSGFKTPMDIVVPENRTINTKILCYSANINSITLKKGSRIEGPLICHTNTIIPKLIVEDNCYLYDAFCSYETGKSGLVIDEVEIKNNVQLKGSALCGAIGGIEVHKLTIGDNFKPYARNPIQKVVGLKEITIGNNFNIVVNGDNWNAYHYSQFINDMPDLETIIIGDNAIVEGKLGERCTKLQKVIFGENAQLINFKDSGKSFGAFSAIPNIQYVEIGKGAQIGTATFMGCTSLKEITLYLTEEQAQDRSKIPTEWQTRVPNATFTVRDENDTEKIIWDVTYPEPATN